MEHEATESQLLLAGRKALIEAVEGFAQDMGLDQPEWLAAIRRAAEQGHDELAGVRDRKSFEALSNLTASCLSLVREEELDFSLDLTSLLRSVTEQCGPELGNLHRRYLTLFGGEDLPLEQCPVGPVALTRALRDLAEAVQFTAEQREKFFDRGATPLAQRLKAMYAALIDVFRNAGVEPKPLPHFRGAAPLGGGKVQTSERAESVVEAAPNADDEPSQEGLIRQLQRRRAQSLAESDKRKVKLDEGLLEVVRERVRTWLAERQSMQESAVVHVAGTEHTALLPAPNEAALAMVEQVFDAIATLDDLGSEVKRLVALLQIPFLRLALIDDELLSDPGHPARTLLERVVDIGRRLPEGVATHPMLRNLTDVVLGLQRGDANGAEAFARALAAIDFDERERMRRSEALARQTQESAQRAERRESSLVEACAQIQALLHSDTPPVVRGFLESWWVQVVARFLYSGGTADPRGSESLELARQLVEAARPQATDDQPTIGNADFARLISALKVGVGLLGLNTEAADRLLTPVVSAVMALRSGRLPATRRPPRPVVPVLSEMSGTTSLKLLHHVGCPTLVGASPPEASPPQGSWLSLTLPDDTRMVGQVGWISPGGRIVLVVDPDRTVAMAVSRRALVDLAGRGRCRLIERGSVIDKVAARLGASQPAT